MKNKDKKSIETAKKNSKINQKFLNKINSKKPKKIDFVFAELHHEEFKTMDCLSCANCCKTTSPIFRDADVRRISKSLRIKESKFIDDYLKIDEDNDYVLKKSPCIFLDQENKCQIYDIRPLACKEYPHTDRKNMHQITELTYQNTFVCPVVSRIVEKIVQKDVF